MTTSSTLGNGTRFLSHSETHNVRKPSPWFGIIFFVLLWLTITTMVWLVSTTGSHYWLQQDYQYPIQGALVSFLQAIGKAVVEFLRMLPWPHF